MLLAHSQLEPLEAFQLASWKIQTCPKYCSLEQTKPRCTTPLELAESFLKKTSTARRSNATPRSSLLFIPQAASLQNGTVLEICTRKHSISPKQSVQDLQATPLLQEQLKLCSNQSLLSKNGRAHISRLVSPQRVPITHARHREMSLLHRRSQDLLSGMDHPLVAGPCSQTLHTRRRI